MTGLKYDVPAEREGAGFDRLGEVRRGGPPMDANAFKVVVETRLKEAKLIYGEWLSDTECGDATCKSRR
jgi:hypothetical protein